FEEEGFVLFSACNIGQNRVLMLALAKALKTTVYAGTGKSFSTLGYWNTGEYAYAMRRAGTRWAFHDPETRALWGGAQSKRSVGGGRWPWSSLMLTLLPAISMPLWSVW